MFRPKYVRLLSNANVFYIEIMIKMKRNTTFYTYKMRTMKSRKKKLRTCANMNGILGGLFEL